MEQHKLNNEQLTDFYADTPFATFSDYISAKGKDMNVTILMMNIMTLLCFME